MNRIQIIGRLGAHPVMSQSARGPVANFSIATNEIWTDRETGKKKEHTEWHQAVCFDRHAEIIGQYLSKGDEVFIEGRQRSSQWTDKDGKLQKGVQIRVDNFRMFARNPRDAMASALSTLELAKNAIAKAMARGPNLSDEDFKSLEDVPLLLENAQWDIRGGPPESE